MKESRTMNALRTGAIMGRESIMSLTILIILTVLSAVVVVRSSHEETEYTCNEVDTDGDKLAYVSADDNLMLYIPRDRTETTLLEDVSNFKLSPDGRVAFTRLDPTDRGLYIFNPSRPEQPPINISPNPEATAYPIAWSPDRCHLAFGTYQDEDDKSLHIWNGKSVIDITLPDPLDTVNRYYVNWRHDGRLVITVVHGWSSLDIPPEIYIWDGKSTTNLSQNPEGWDGDAGWSRDGKLLFYSDRNDEPGYYVWDGESFRDGTPDVGSFYRVAPELEIRYPNWVDNETVAFTIEAISSRDYKKEIVFWNLETESIVKQYAVSSELANSGLVEGGQVIVSTHLASGIPSIYFEVENMGGDILFSEHIGAIYAWSPDGYLAYCGIEDGYSRLLSIWNGEETWIVARVSYKPAQWQNGGITFSCNNG